MEPIIRDLLNISERVNVRSKLNIISADPTDNIFLNLALDGKANVIVSGDHHLLDVNDSKTFR
jgi:putative PIN family toxin of toxin-antitoxin system